MTPSPTLAPVEPPYDADLAAALDRWMPPGSAQEPLLLFRVLARHRDLFDRMRPLGAGILGRGRLDPRLREVLILRTTARAGARYEWGVHVAAFADRVGLTPEQVRSTAAGGPDDPVWSASERLAVRAADALHDHGELSAELQAQLAEHLGADQVLEMVICCGWYRLLATVIRSAGLTAEPWAAPWPSAEPRR